MNNKILKSVKRIIPGILALSIIGQISAYAFEYPNGFWSINDKYEQALNSNDYSNIAKYALQEIDLLSQTPDSYQKRELMSSRYNTAGLAFAEQRDFENAYKTFSDFYDYAKNYSDRYDFAKGAYGRAKQYQPRISLYTDNGGSPYYGAVNEKENGVLFGLCSNGATRNKTPNESMVLTYQELGQHLLSYNEEVVKKASKQGKAVEFALNCPNKKDDIININNMTPYLKEISDMLKKYPNTPIYLRFAAEFDIWDKQKPEPDDFIYAFRLVSDYFKSRNSNVAMVWSPNQVSSWDIEDIDIYYPGDKYVDWVGMSLYAQKYFLGDKNSDETSEIVFKTGINSDPVIAIEDIVNKYGDRKPIMLSESGCGHTLIHKNNGKESYEDTSDFALTRLKQYLCYLPMVYPQIKLMAYFDWYVDDSAETSDYRLSENSTLQNEYLNLTKGARFIQDKYTSDTTMCYRKIGYGSTVNGVFPVSCYAHSYDAELETVTYFIDGNYAATSNQIPYTEYIDATAYTGNHTLTAIAAFSDGKTLTCEHEIYINNPDYKNSGNISVEISGKNISFDQEPLLYNDRTMVPMRKIFEELGATVTWDNNTQTATGVKGDRTVKVTVGNNSMYVNNTKYTLDTAPIILSSRTLVPVRAIAEGLGCDVDWNERSLTVSITPKTFSWSDWSESLPNNIDEDLYYIESEKQYRHRTREKIYYQKNYETPFANLYDYETIYGTWSDWQDNYISSSNTLEVQTQTISSPKNYHYAHWCTGNEPDESIRYKTSSQKFCDQAVFHDLGWYNERLTGGDSYDEAILYKSDGKKYRCSNSCYVWYLMETTGGDLTQYRCRDVKTIYYYWEWDAWGYWSDWSADDYYNYNSDTEVDTQSRTVYRYKEK